MKSIFEIILGGDTYEILSKGGLAGSAVGALRLNGTATDKLVKLTIGILTAVFIGPLLIDVVNTVTLKFWSFKIEGSSGIGATGFIVGYLGVDGLSRIWGELKLSQLIRKFLLFWLTNKKNGND